MVESLCTFGVDANSTDVLVQKLIVNLFSVLTLDVVLAATVREGKGEIGVFFVVNKAMAVVADDVELVEHTVLGLEQELVAALVQVNLSHISHGHSTTLEPIVKSIRRWQEDGRVGVKEKFGRNHVGSQDCWRYCRCQHYVPER